MKLMRHVPFFSIPLALFAILATPLYATAANVTTVAELTTALADTSVTDIVLAPGDYQLTAELTVSRAVTIRGTDRENTVVKAKANTRAVNISVADAKLSTLTVEGNGTVSGNGACVYMTANSTVTNCVLRNGTADGNDRGGGGIRLEAGLVVDTIITNNTTVATVSEHTGGALYIKGSAIAERCLVAFNKETCRGHSTAGAAGVLINSKTAVVRNCTIYGNDGQGVGGVRFHASGLVTNCIVAANTSYRNTAGNATSTGTHFFRNSAIDNKHLYDKTYTNYTGAIDFVDPAHGDWRPRLSSAAFQNGAALGAFPRVPTGSPECDFSTPAKAGVAPFAATFEAVALNFPAGAPLAYTWDFGDGSAAETTAVPTATHAYSQPGLYAVSLTVTGGGESATVSYAGEIRTVPATIYVTDVNASAAEPYSTWATAATDLQTAVDYATDGVEIVVDDVNLPVRNDKAVIVTKGVTIRSRSGDPTRAAIGRYGTSTKFRLMEVNNAKAVISGLALENGNLSTSYNMGGNLRINKAGGTVTNCIIRNGTISRQYTGGAGISLQAGLMTHCVVSNNYSEGQSDKYFTGAVCLCGGTVESCLITGNRSSTYTPANYLDVAGVAVEGGTLRNSTIAGNSAKTCGGVWIRNNTSGRVVNCLIAGNTSTGLIPPGNDFYATSGYYQYFSYCATTAEIPDGGTGCVYGDLPFQDAANSDYTPAFGSVALGKGLVEDWMATGRDLVGNPRLGGDDKVDIGAIERCVTSLDATLTSDRVSGAAPLAVTFTVLTTAESATFSWDFDGDGIADETTSAATISHVYSALGSVRPSVTVSTGTASATAILADWIVVAPATIYVVPSTATATPTPPYATWETAAKSINDAVAVAGDGSRIVVRAGNYPLTNTVTIACGAKMSSETGIREDVVISAKKSGYRLVVLNHADAELSCVTVSGGQTDSSSGVNVYVHSLGGTVSNCVVRNGRITNGNECTGVGMRLDGGMAVQCVVTGNYFKARGNTHTGGVLAIGGYAVAEACLVARNVCTSSSGTEVCSPVHMTGGTLRNCTVADNISSNGFAGVYYYAGGNGLGVPVSIVNCLFADNVSHSSIARAGLANDGALGKMTTCASDVDPSATYAARCFCGPLPFKRRNDADYRPTAGSVAIGRGTITASIAAGARDLLGFPFLKDDGKADIGAFIGNGRASTVIMLR